MRCVVNDDECVPGRLRRGMCERHYRRVLAHGTTANPRVDNLRHYAVDETTGCWVWQGAVWKNGYGKLSVKMHGTRLAHRAFYTEHVGPIPERHDIDHLCHNADPQCIRGGACLHRRCVNPKHLDPVRRKTNLVRAIESRALCSNGLHDLTLPGATRPSSNACTECWRIRYRAAGKRYRARLEASRLT